jgi:basic membrane protein A and related proteins
LETDVLENVSEDYDAAYKVIDEAAASGSYHMIVGTSFGYQFPMFDMADLYPNMRFLHVSGFLGGKPNFSTVFGKIFQARFLSGMAAGLMTRTAELGFVAAFRVPEVYRGVNAFFLGVRSVRPDAVLHLHWSNTWFDPDLEKYTAETLLDNHYVDVMAHFQDSQEPQLAAAHRGAYSVGYHSDMGRFIGKLVLASARWDWTIAYDHFISQVLDDAWIGNEAWWGSLADGAADIGLLSAIIPQDKRDVVLEWRQRLIDGEVDVFCGERSRPWVVNASSAPIDESECLGNGALLGDMWSLHPDINDLGDISIPLVRVDISEGVRIAMQVLAGIALLVCVLFLVLTAVYREKRVIRFSSPVFLALSLIGAMMMLTSVYPLSTAPPTQDTCIWAPWLLALGFSVFIGGLLAKNWRIYRVFSGAGSLRVTKISNTQLIPFVVACCASNVLLLILFTTISMPDAEVNRSDPDLDAYEFRVKCAYDDAANVLIWCLIGWNSFLLVVAVVLTFQLRNTHRSFNESRHLAMAIYVFTFCLAVLVPVIVIIDDDPEAQYVVATLGIILSTLLAVLSIFGPKFYVIARRGDFKSDSSFTGTSGTNNGSILLSTASSPRSQRRTMATDSQ